MPRNIFNLLPSSGARSVAALDGADVEASVDPVLAVTGAPFLSRAEEPDEAEAIFDIQQDMIRVQGKVVGVMEQDRDEAGVGL